jgi:RNA polymerase sigma factor (sigma-70 family)
MVRDVGLAEDLAQDALVAALEHWPARGLPDNPGAWLMTTAKNKALDRLRQGSLQRRRREELGADADARGEHQTPDFTDAADDADFGDDLLRLMFTACHPVLPKEAQVALTLKLLAGLTTAEIARAFVQSEATIAQRIVRAKRSLKEADVPFELPRGEEVRARLDAVLESIYLIFNEGYTATAGDDWMRPALCEEALRLARMLAGLAPDKREAHGLAALLELQASRLRARTDALGKPILLLDQNRAHWDWLLVGRGLASLEQARRLTDAAGPYELQAAIAACHARARSADDTDWHAIVAAYDALYEVMPSPIVALNRAVAVGRAQGAAAGRREQAHRSRPIDTDAPYARGCGPIQVRASAGETGNRARSFARSQEDGRRSASFRNAVKPLGGRLVEHDRVARENEGGDAVRARDRLDLAALERRARDLCGIEEVVVDEIDVARVDPGLILPERAGRRVEDLVHAVQRRARDLGGRGRDVLAREVDA